MTVPPCSQLTSRIVPASTLRRKDATIAGTTNSTPARMAIINIQGCRSICSLRVGAQVGSNRGYRAAGRPASPPEVGDGAAVALAVHVLDAQPVAGAHAHPGRPVLGP